MTFPPMSWAFRLEDSPSGFPLQVRARSSLAGFPVQSLTRNAAPIQCYALANEEPAYEHGSALRIRPYLSGSTVPYSYCFFDLYTTMWLWNTTN